MRFTVKALDCELPNGKYTDAASPGLCFRVRGKYRNWIFRRYCSGKAREVALGSYPKVSIAEARKSAAQLSGMNDEEFLAFIERKKSTGESPTRLTFRQAAEKFAAWNIEVGNWQELDKAHKVFNGRMRMYVFPVIGDCFLDEVTPALVASIAQPIWHMPDTVDRCLRFTRQVFNWSIAKNLTSISNPADRTGPLQYLLPRERSPLRSCRLFFAAFMTVLEILLQAVVSCFPYSPQLAPELLVWQRGSRLILRIENGLFRLNS